MKKLRQRYVKVKSDTLQVNGSKGFRKCDYWVGIEKFLADYKINTTTLETGNYFPITGNCFLDRKSVV